MYKIMRLISVQLWAVLGDVLSIGGTKKKKAKVLYTGILFFVLLMSGISLFYNLMIGSGLKFFDSTSLLPAIMMSVTCIIIFMTTVFKIKGTIFGFRDYDLVMSLPVSTGAVIACRLLILYAFNFMFVIIMIIPMMIAYGILEQPGIVFYIINFTAMFFIPLVPIVAASVLGTAIAYAASRFRHSNLLNIIFSLILLLAVMGSSFFIGGNAEQLLDIGKALTDRVNSLYPLAQLYTDAAVHYDIPAFFVFITISLGAFLIYAAVVAKLFIKLNTIILTGRARGKYKMGELKTSSPLTALYRKELKRYFSSPLYVLNTGFGIVLLTIGAVALLFVDLEKLIGDPTAVQVLIANVPLYINFCVIMTCTTMASISLEGKSLWIMKSLPVSAGTVYLSKIAVNLTVAAPALIDMIIIGIALKLGVMQTLLQMLITVACVVLIACYGLIINLLFPNFNWTTETVVIKQSAACMITIFSGIGYVIIQLILSFLLPSALLSNLGYLLLTVVLDVVLYILLTGYGVRRYREL